jgi:alpha-N-arabinofuranosidase
LVASTHFDIFHDHAERLVMANIAQTVNVLQAMILTDDGPDGTLVLTPTYHVFEMNKGHQDARRLPTHVVEGPRARPSGGYQVDLLSASASTKDDRALISLTNIDAATEASIVLDLRGREIRNRTGRLLTSSALQDHNTPAGPDQVRPTEWDAIEDHPRGLQVTLPPHSFATIELELG